MRKLLVSLGLLLAISHSVRAQRAACPMYDKLMSQAKTYADSAQYDNAVNKYKTAKACNPAKADEVLEKIAEVKMRQIAASTKPPVSSGPSAGGSGTPGHGDPAPAPKVDTFLVDSIKIFQRLLHEAKYYDTVYERYIKETEKLAVGSPFPVDKRTPFTMFSARLMDYVYFMLRGRIELGEKMLPAKAVAKNKPAAVAAIREMEGHRNGVLKDFLMPDTLFTMPDSTLFIQQCPDDENLVYGYTDYSDYKKLQIRFLNLRLSDFTLTTDSAITLTDSGKFSTVIASAANYDYHVTRGVDYLLRRNRVQYAKSVWTRPTEKRLVDNQGNVIFDLSSYSSNTFFFSHNAAYMTSWDLETQLLLFDVHKKTIVNLPNSRPSLTESMASDSRTIAWYNRDTKMIYLGDMSGHVLKTISGSLTGIDSITNIDFTGGDAFLKVNNDDSIALFDLATQKRLLLASKSLVSELVVSPNGEDILLTCNAAYKVGMNRYNISMGILTDKHLNVKSRLFADCDTYFYTPDGAYIIGYGGGPVMRWRTTGKPSDPGSRTCLTSKDLVGYNCLPLSSWADVTDADLLEKGARAFKDLAEEEPDARLRTFYYRQSAALFEELALGDARNIRWERVPFYYDWYNWIQRRMGDHHLGDQFVRELAGVNAFEHIVNSPDSVYPQQLYYAANGHWLLQNIYDSMRWYNRDFIEETYKEIDLRQRVFNKDPENTDNIYYFTKAFKRLAEVCDTVGWTALRNGHYAQRLETYRAEERLLTQKLKILPDSFGLRPLYIDALIQLAPSYLYSYVNQPRQSGRALDSALYYSEKGLALSPAKHDSAKLLLVEARVYLLQPGKLEKSLALYREVRQLYPALSRESLLNQLAYLRLAGAENTDAMASVEQYLKTEEK